MSKPMTDVTDPYNLIDFRNNVYSQYGEDGIFERIFAELAIAKGWFVEFGAWDGRHLSNTRHLFEKGWSGVFIEGDPEKFQDLERNYAGNERVTTCLAMVGWEENNGLDTILQRTAIPLDFDLLSIDIDGNDYHVWDAVKQYHPKVVIIETNMTFPYNVEFVQSEPGHFGASALSMYRLGQAKGYQLVCYNINNCIFVRDDLAETLNLINRAFVYLFHLGRQESAGGFFVSDYQGRWHWLHPQILGFGVYAIEYPNEVLRRGHVFKFFLQGQISLFKQLFKRPRRRDRCYNQSLVKADGHLKINNDRKELTRLF